MAKLARVKNGVVENVIVGDPAEFSDLVDITNSSPQPGPNWLYDGSVFSEPPEVQPDLGTIITRFAFRQRFTFAERVAIRSAADSDTEVMVWLEDLQTASFIDLTRSEAIEGAQMLESKGLIDSGRADEVLNDPVQPNEVP